MPLPDSEMSRFTSHLPRLWRRFQDAFAARFSSERSEKRSRQSLLFLTAIVLTFLILPRHHHTTVLYRAGQIANEDIRAPRDFLVEDQRLTREKQTEAAAKIPNIYIQDNGVPGRLMQHFRDSLAILKTAGGDRSEVKKSFESALGVEISSQEYGLLLKAVNEQQLLADMEQGLQRIFAVMVVADQNLFLSDLLTGISLRNASNEEVPHDFSRSEPIDLKRARELVATIPSSARVDLQRAVKSVVARLLKPNLFLSREKTEELKAAAITSVKPVLLQVKRGEMIVRDGDRVSADQEMKLAGIASESTLGGKVSSILGALGIVLVMLYFPYRFALKNIRKFRPTYKDLLLLSLITTGHFFLLQTLFAITPSLQLAFSSINPVVYVLLFPFAASAIIVRIFVNSEVALVFAAICAPLAALLYESLPVALYALIASIIGAHGVRHCDNRGIIFTAGLKVSCVNIAMALSYQLFTQSLFTMQTPYIVLFAFAGGIFSSVLASGGIPLLESVFQYTTDIKLLELTNLNSPVLRELMLKAPGTYHHSVIVGTLAEAAAEAINANPLLARVAAYYHDIGKTSKAQYFIENQGGAENRHDKLSPHMSALILIAHIKEGAELAKQQGLGQPVVDIIRQSHGSALIKYFYQKAVDQAQPGQVINEHEFRYPGPKPQTREAGLVMLADSVEAASRTLTDYSPARIQGLVQKIINKIFIDGQLDECELTLKNLHQIAWSFNQILSGIHHQRIDYPQPAFKERGQGGRRTGEYRNNEPAKTPSDLDEDVEKGDCDDLKRLGMYF